MKVKVAALKPEKVWDLLVIGVMLVMAAFAYIALLPQS